MLQETSHQSFARHLTFSIASLPRSVAVEVVFDAAPAAVLGELEESLGLFEARDGQTVLRARTDSIAATRRRVIQFPHRRTRRTAHRIASSCRASHAGAG
jgi:transcriptional regulator of aromatic amino acid metabolism